MEKINENLILKECEKCGKLKEVFQVQFTIKSILPKVSSREPLIFGRYKICEDCFHKLNISITDFLTETSSPAKPEGNVNEVKPCPFCGSDEYAWQDHPEKCYLYRIVKQVNSDCMAYCKESCEESWNIRPVEDKLKTENKRLLGVINRAYNADLYGCQEIIKEEVSRNT